MTPFWRGVSLRPIGASCRDDSECIARLCRYSTTLRAGLGQRPGNLGKVGISTHMDLRTKLGQRTAWAEAGSSMEENASGIESPEQLRMGANRVAPFLSSVYPEIDQVKQREEMQQRRLGTGTPLS